MFNKTLKSVVLQSLLYSAAAAFMLFAMTSFGVAQNRGLFGCMGCKKGCTKHVQCCPECAEEVCSCSCVKVEESRSCFKVDYKTICIPKVKLPWESCCKPRCAEARSVKVLLVHRYKCPKCKCRWEVQQPKPPVLPGQMGIEGEVGIVPGDQHLIDGQPFDAPQEGMPVPSSELPSSDQPLNEVPAAPQPTQRPADTSTQSNQPTSNPYKDYFAPAKFGKKK